MHVHGKLRRFSTTACLCLQSSLNPFAVHADFVLTEHGGVDNSVIFCFAHILLQGFARAPDLPWGNSTLQDDKSNVCHELERIA